MVSLLYDVERAVVQAAESMPLRASFIAEQTGHPTDLVAGILRAFTFSERMTVVTIIDRFSPAVAPRAVPIVGALDGKYAVLYKTSSLDAARQMTDYDAKLARRS